MEQVPDLGPAPQRLTVDVETVRQLVAEQFPAWAHLPVTPVPKPGWDNHTFRLGNDMAIRLPSASEYELAVSKEHRWLPALAAQLPVPIPTPLAKGRPGSDYPFQWSIYIWLPGEPPSPSTLTDPLGLANDVSDVVAALQRIPTKDGPQPGVHNWFRGGTLRTFDPTARRALAELEHVVDVARVAAVWDDAQRAPWNGADVWFHGDLAAGNLLVEGGRLAAVIDFGTCGVGDPSCDLAVAWTLLDPTGRELLRDRLAVDDDTWVRGRGWALWKSLSNLAEAERDRDERSSIEAQRVITAILDDDQKSGRA